MRAVKKAGFLADGFVLFDHRLVLYRQSPAGEIEAVFAQFSKFILYSFEEVKESADDADLHRLF
jgi:hypothetical protein